MSEREIVQRMIAALGQSQADRDAQELAPDYFLIDPSTPRELLAQASALASHVRYYERDPNLPSLDWSGFFPGSDAELDAMSSSSGDVAPHLGLFGAFLELTQAPRALLNGLTAQHVALQWRALGLAPRAALPDRAHLVLELKPGRPSLAISEDRRFIGGKDAEGKELLYRPLHDAVIGQGRVVELRSVYNDGQALFFAPVPPSADGLGAPLTNERAGWPGFGNASLPAAPLGFACASPVLRLQQAERRIQVEFVIPGLAASALDLKLVAAALRAELTGPDGWFSVPAISAQGQGNTLGLAFDLSASAPAVVGYDPAIHALSLTTREPVVQFLLQAGSPLGHTLLGALRVTAVRISVVVNGLRDLLLENDQGALNPQKPFLPFGPQPVKGSRFLVGSAEALAKRVTDLQLQLDWLAPPEDLAGWYSGYANVEKLEKGVAVEVQFRAQGLESVATTELLLPPKILGPTTLHPTAPSKPVVADWGAYDRDLIVSLANSGTRAGRKKAEDLRFRRPNHERAGPSKAEPRSGFITITLQQDLLHESYRYESLSHALQQGNKTVLREPYTPVVREIVLGYHARSVDVDLASTGPVGEASLRGAEVEFFHIGCFGQVREHAHLRELAKLVDVQPRLLPNYPDQGELLLGLAGLGAGDAVSLLVSVLEGSSDPELPAPQVLWAVLQDNYWRVLGPRELVRDGSGNFTTTGVVEIVLPPGTDLDHTWMPSGLVWLKASIGVGVAGACRMLGAAANAVEVKLAAEGGAHKAGFATAGTITRLKKPEPALKAISQPAASFGGRGPEDAATLTRRAAERLRHKNRCVTPWDYERLLLEAFPAVHKIKCVPHASDRSWFAPGHLKLIAIPKLRDEMLDPLSPRVSVDTLSRMEQLASEHAGMGVRVWARSPKYPRVRAEFRARFRPGFAFNHYRNETEAALTRALSPWAFDSQRTIEFGGRVYRSALLDLVERLPWVDFVTDFRMGVVGDAGQIRADVSVLAPDAPDEILASASEHRIEPLLGD